MPSTTEMTDRGVGAEEAATALGIDLSELSACLRHFAVSELVRITTIVRRGVEPPNFDRFHRLMCSIEAVNAVRAEKRKAAE